MAMVSKYLWLALVFAAKGGRDYLGLVLRNGMRVVLISDPSTEMAGAAMAVDVGAIADPKEMQGLAHFCEHMLFMSGDQEFIKHVDGVGGAYNAFTGYEETNLHFSVPHQHLEAALHGFSQLFINPHFEESIVEGVVQEIDSEFLGRLNGDRERATLVRKTCLNSSHPFSYFEFGNYKSLYELPKASNHSPHQLLNEFYIRHYSANLMNLAVVGHEPIQALEEMVIRLFSKVTNRNLVRPSVPDSPFLNEDSVQVTIEPTKPGQTMTLQFDLPSQKMYFREKPLQYILYFIKHEGPGSLVQLLKGKGWVTFISIDADNDYFDFCLVDIVLELTSAGLENRHVIVKLFFEYVALIRADGVTSTYFKEIAAMHEVNFNHQERGDVMEEVISIARGLRIPSPLATTLSDAKLITHFNATLITDTLAYFNPNHLRLHIISALPSYDQTEPWANVPFTKDSFVIAKPTGIPLTLPDFNPFIPTDFTLIPSLPCRSWW
ncbi:metalloprotease [Entomophthora muscae]|uniref:Metalloprotease n=1 Tax=Entomophthora muscae TaxID=34485 RepID=A0ACC2TE76_9FUNG|nr:metalloprotease [Entomophthora muscae]